jgi:hypothetical protein
MVHLPSQPLGTIDPLFERVVLETAALTFGLAGIRLSRNAASPGRPRPSVNSKRSSAGTPPDGQ